MIQFAGQILTVLYPERSYFRSEKRPWSGEIGGEGEGGQEGGGRAWRGRRGGGNEKGEKKGQEEGGFHRWIQWNASVDIDRVD